MKLFEYLSLWVVCFLALHVLNVVWPDWVVGGADAVLVSGVVVILHAICTESEKE